MFLKTSVSFLLLFCFINCNLAAPAPREESAPPFKDVEESFKRLTNEIEKSVEQVTQSTQWIYKNLVSIARTSLEKGFQNVASWLFEFIVRVEFLSMADGSHFNFPLNGKPEIEQEYKTVAIAVSKLLMNLRTMERTDQILTNVTRYLVTEDVEPLLKGHKTSAEKMFRTFLHSFFKTVDHRLETEKDLRDEYEKQKAEATDAVKRDPTMRKPLFTPWAGESKDVSAEEMTAFVQDKKIFQQGIANKLFLKQAVKHFSMIFSAQSQERYLLARALIQKARSSNSGSKIDEIYHQALEQAGKATLNEMFDGISNVLFNSIKTNLESEPTLNAEIRAIMKQIEGSTVYDTDMFYVDFFPV